MVLSRGAGARAADRHARPAVRPPRPCPTRAALKVPPGDVERARYRPRPRHRRAAAPPHRRCILGRRPEAAAVGGYRPHHRRRHQGGRRGGRSVTGFSAAWLDRREPADHRSRNRKLEHALARHFDGWRPVTVVDLGCGSGSNLRATAPLLGPEQHWTLVDYEQDLLDAAAERLAAWADGSDRKDGRLALFKGAKRINVEFRRADIARDLQAALAPGANLVTASALFDLVSADFIGRFRGRDRRRQVGVLHRPHLRRRPALGPGARCRRGAGRCLPRPSAARQGFWSRGRPRCTRRAGRGLQQRRLLAYRRATAPGGLAQATRR